MTEETLPFLAWVTIGKGLSRQQNKREKKKAWRPEIAPGVVLVFICAPFFDSAFWYTLPVLLLWLGPKGFPAVPHGVWTFFLE